MARVGLCWEVHLGLVEQVRGEHGDGEVGLDEPWGRQAFYILSFVYDYYQVESVKQRLPSCCWPKTLTGSQNSSPESQYRYPWLRTSWFTKSAANEEIWYEVILLKGWGIVSNEWLNINSPVLFIPPIFPDSFHLKERKSVKLQVWVLSLFSIKISK